MQIERDGDLTRLTLNAEEAALLARALERATFIDTPANEQAAIANFATSALASLRAPK